LRKSKANDLLRDHPVAGNIKPSNGLPLRVLAPSLSTRGRPVYFDFRFCSPLGSFAQKLPELFLRHVEMIRSNSARAVYTVICRFFNRGILSQADHADISLWNADRWQEVVGWYVRFEIQRQTLNDKTKSTYRATTLSFLRLLQDSGDIPRFDFPPPIKIKNAGKIPPFSHILRQPLKDVQPADVQEVFDELDSLSDAEDPVKILKKIDLLSRLLLEHWTSEARRYWNDFLAMEDAVDADDTFSASTFLRDYSDDDGITFKGSWRGPLSTDLAVVKLVRTRYQGLLPGPGEEGYALSVWLQDHGRARKISSLLHSTIDTLTPFYALILHDENLVLNPSSAQTMTDASISDREDPAVKTISWEKGRTGETYFENCLSKIPGDEGMTVPQAINCIQAMRKALEPFADPKDRTAIMLVRLAGQGRSEIRPASGEALVAGWTRSLQKHPVLSTYPIRPVHMRSTALYREFLVSGADMLSVNRKAKHKVLSTSQQYVNVNSTAFMAARDARKVQDFLLLKSTPDRKVLHEELGLDAEVAEKVARAASQAGFLGWNFSDPADHENLVAAWLTGVEHILIESAEVAAEMIAFRRHLLDHAHTLREGPDWYECWALLLLFLNSGLAQMRPDIRLAGEKLAAEYEIEYGEL
jgi:hypothetical protein